MKAMILAAGKGTRMLPLTADCPKPLLPIRGKPMIIHTLESLWRAGIRDVVINASHLAVKLQSALGDGNQFGIKIKYSTEEVLLETGGGIEKALPLLGLEPFLVVSGDLYTEFDFKRLTQRAVNTGHLVLVPNPPHHEKGDYSLVDNLISWPNGTTYNYSGIALLNPAMFYPLGRYGQVYKLSKLFSPLIDARKLTGEIFLGEWQNIGTPEQLALQQLKLYVDE